MVEGVDYISELVVYIGVLVDWYSVVIVEGDGFWMGEFSVERMVVIGGLKKYDWER